MLESFSTEYLPLIGWYFPHLHLPNHSSYCFHIGTVNSPNWPSDLISVPSCSGDFAQNARLWLPYSHGHTRTFGYKHTPLFWPCLISKFSVTLWENTFGYKRIYWLNVGLVLANIGNKRHKRLRVRLYIFSKVEFSLIWTLASQWEVSFIAFDPLMGSWIDCGQAAFKLTDETSRQ